MCWSAWRDFQLFLWKEGLIVIESHHWRMMILPNLNAFSGLASTTVWLFTIEFQTLHRLFFFIKLWHFFFCFHSQVIQTAATQRQLWPATTASCVISATPWPTVPTWSWWRRCCFTISTTTPSTDAASSTASTVHRGCVSHRNTWGR